MANNEPILIDTEEKLIAHVLSLLPPIIDYEKLARVLYDIDRPDMLWCIRVQDPK